jgi:ribonuclease HI
MSARTWNILGPQLLSRQRDKAALGKSICLSLFTISSAAMQGYDGDMDDLFSIGCTGLSADLHFDGSAIPNPGPNCACGFVLHVAGDELPLTQSIWLGVGTNNTAEYMGMIHGMRAALQCGVKVLRVFGDSRIVIDRMNSRKASKHAHIESLRQQAVALADQFDDISFNWVPREENAMADSLT